MVIWKVQVGLKYEEHAHKKRSKGKKNEVIVDLHMFMPYESTKYCFINNPNDRFLYGIKKGLRAKIELTKER